ncbi:MAG TPA: lytic transglycosylase domain-containing protein [Candidatus Methylomirabilis sp.]|nr:lytic transglycosylase domain-containing protein [Candidatus Methylomirabilis sp.]HSC69708.1 lytic transglycosylase domain-containing protein [Candidatus Methylomirabilis sp.]
MCLVLLVLGANRSVALRLSGSVAREPELQSVEDDPVTDQFLQRFRRLQGNTAQRHTLAAAIVAAAAQNRLDPDLLFALVAVESSFDSTALSPKGARGLGQVMFPTAQAVAPTLVRRPEDLYDVRRNLAVTARHLRELLTAGGGDLGAALTMYHTGPHFRRLPRRGDDRYVGLICLYYASLKVRRRHGDPVAMTARTAGRSED